MLYLNGICYFLLHSLGDSARAMSSLQLDGTTKIVLIKFLIVQFLFLFSILITYVHLRYSL